MAQVCKLITETTGKRTAAVCISVLFIKCEVARMRRNKIRQVVTHLNECGKTNG